MKEKEENSDAKEKHKQESEIGLHIRKPTNDFTTHSFVASGRERRKGRDMKRRNKRKRKKEEQGDGKEKHEKDN